MALVKIARNAVVAKVITSDEKAEMFVNSLLSYEVESNGIGTWSGKSSFFDVNNKTFPAGFLHVVQSELTKIGHTVQVIQKPHATPLGEESPIVDEFGNDNPDYDYQMKALRQVEKHGNGIIQVATGGGKSKIAKLIMSRYRRMTLFLTTRGILLYQMKEQVDDIGFNTGVIGDGQMKFVKGVNMGMVQTLVQALEIPDMNQETRSVIKTLFSNKKNNPDDYDDEDIEAMARERYDAKVKKRNAIIKFLSMIEVVIGEEAHEVGGESYYEILRHCKNATIRVALTATPFMRDSAADNMRLMAAFGPVLLEVSEKLLIDRGILAKPYFKFVNSKPHEKLRKSSPFERAYKLGYTENPYMHEDMLRDVKNASALNLPTLTLVSRKNHGNEILKLYRDAGIRCEFIRGENDMEDRKTQLNKLANGELDCVIGTTIVDVGVDVPMICFVQLAGGMKAQVAMRQRIGRGLRKKKGMNNITFIADYSCNINNYLRDHAGQRRRIVENTPGFAEGILPDGQEFNWSMFREGYEE